MPATRSQSRSSRTPSVLSASSSTKSSTASHSTRFGGVFSETLNGNILPKPYFRAKGTTFGLLFPLRGAKEVRTQFRSTNSNEKAPVRRQHHRYIHFLSSFAKEVQNDPLYVVVIIHQHQRYLVAGTFDDNMPDENQAIKSLGCTSSFRGDIAICFYNSISNREEEFLYGIPSYPSFQDRNDALKHVVDRFVRHVRNVILNGGSLKSALSHSFTTFFSASVPALYQCFLTVKQNMKAISDNSSPNDIAKKQSTSLTRRQMLKIQLRVPINSKNVTPCAGSTNTYIETIRYTIITDDSSFDFS
ncbi:hypothetical protein BT96DRAFT_938101 [Gymnopus androsaceus JB14]|uniref:Uncharacterized protein n=1 Tax=Gymnopus androsaceus JB14 TaxID=1447944 RepID=A0A6A4HSY0_9AGAR|nr:hypothetical protein BT96DRAFT_938101 [Gymnopus androsaceus JB14]